MKTRYFGVVLAGLLALAVAGSAMALDGNYTGALRHGADRALYGSYGSIGGLLLGHDTHANTQPWPFTGNGLGRIVGQFGMEFDGPAVVDSFTINQVAGRATIQTLDVYANGVKIGTLNVPNQTGSQTLSFADCLVSNDGVTNVQSVTATWLTLVYTAGNQNGTGNYNVGVLTYSFGGTALPSTSFSPNPNIHRELGLTAANITAYSQWTGWNANNNNASNSAKERLIDGIVSNQLSTVTSSLSDEGGIYFLKDNRANGEKSVSITYGGVAKTVASVGLAFFQDDFNQNGGYCAPQYADFEDSHGNKVRVYIDAALSQYGRYNLLAGNIITTKNADYLLIENGFVSFLDTTSLKVYFPELGPNAGAFAGTNYYSGDNGFCLSEFQAFSFHQSGPIVTLVNIPEPATMSLLALGGLALLRRKRV